MSTPFSRLREILKASKQYVRDRPPLKWTFRALYWSPLCIAFAHYGYTIKYVCGRSMQPTFNPDSSAGRDLVLFDRVSTKIRHEYRRDDVVAIRSPINPRLELVKRIIALPGDTVKTLPPYPIEEVVVPPGHVWVEGDEPFRSEDSNWFGPVSQGLIDSKLTYILLPWDRFGPLNGVFERTPQRGRNWSEQSAETLRKKKREARVTRNTER
ncbi:LexA/Signal peptidase [Thelephora terrestris]|uniref:Mitochondrial inner membrane protease subunit 2 n=1 Tax=Thelephora terrestris TaxID=56493 RepID=A0A9P6L532_9AGAM|nr:LexA/Signal peptidase [Thelephora terrestris]